MTGSLKRTTASAGSQSHPPSAGRDKDGAAAVDAALWRI